MIQVSFGATKLLLESSRGEVRTFATLDTAAQFLLRLDVKTFEVDMACFEHARLRKARPDRAEALKKTRTRPYQDALL